MPDSVVAQVLLRPASGSSGFDPDEPITSQNVDAYRVEPSVVEEATEVLRDLGFDVVQTSEVGVTITGDRAQFDSVFETRIEARSGEEGRRTVYEATEPIQIPEQLSSLVEEIVFPTPPELH